MRTIISTIVIIVVAWGAYLLVNRADSPVATENNNTSEQVGTTGEVREFTVSGSNFQFSPSTIRVNEGDTVRITFQNQGGTHDWVIDEFNARTPVIQAGQSETIEFVADRAGTFEYYCSVGTHRQMGMVGTLIVE
jgi:plastocyanin